VDINHLQMCVSLLNELFSSRDDAQNYSTREKKKAGWWGEEMGHTLTHETYQGLNKHSRDKTGIVIEEPGDHANGKVESLKW
jgi:hypothetical protein